MDTFSTGFLHVQMIVSTVILDWCNIKIIVMVKLH